MPHRAYSTFTLILQEVVNCSSIEPNKPVVGSKGHRLECVVAVTSLLLKQVITLFYHILLGPIKSVERILFSGLPAVVAEPTGLDVCATNSNQAVRPSVLKRSSQGFNSLFFIYRSSYLDVQLLGNEGV